MTFPVKISESAIREFIRDMLDNKQNIPAVITEPPIANVNPTVDIQQKINGDGSENINPAFVPSNALELVDGIKHLVDKTPKLDIPNMYSVIKRAIEDENNRKNNKDGKIMKSDKDVKESLKKAIRNMILEMNPKDLGMSYSGMDSGESDEDDEDSKEKRAYDRADDTGGSSFEEIAKEFGFAGAPGAKAAVNSALESMKYLMGLPEEDRILLVFSAMDDYIKLLQGTGELSDEEVQLLRQNPDIVKDLDGFREHMRKFVKRGIRQSGGASETEF